MLGYSREVQGKVNDVDTSSDEDDDVEGGDESLLHEDYEPLEESIYGWAVSMVVRDVVWLQTGTRLPLQRVARILNSVLIIVATISLQIFLLIAVSRLLSAPSVHNIREVYSKYEVLMYPNHTELTVNGFSRGLPGFLVEENFKKMSEGDAKMVCQVPLAHPFYLISILFIWTLTCQVELRNIFESSVRLLWLTPSASRVEEVLEEDGEEEQTAKVQTLTPLMKVVIGLLVFLPRLLTLLALLYLGCRWLTATLGLGDVLLNGLALEFMVVLKELLYNACASHHNRIATQRLLIRPLRSVNSATFCTFFDSQLWGILSALWAWSYVYYIQMVLPEYRWDLKELCTKNIKAGPMF